MNQLPRAFWSIHTTDLLPHLRTSAEGLTSAQAQERLTRASVHRLRSKKRTDPIVLFLAQFKSPIVLILLFAVALSFFLQARADALIILTIVLASALLSFFQERGAADAVEKLLAIVQTKTTVLRDGRPQEVPVEEIVPGDVVILRAGDLIPSDCLLIDAKDLFVDEAALTGETYPVEKAIGVLPPETPLSLRTNAVFLGTHVVSGTAKAAVVYAGKDSEFGQVSERLRLRPPETEFDRGVRHFGYFLMEVTLLLVLAIFAVNVYLHRPVLDSVLFALALAVGLTPQLLPAIISINLAHGAKRMARQQVIVKRLAAIENFGSMNVLCADKTGTLTEGKVHLHAALDINGQASDSVLRYGYLNAYYETGFSNPIDEALRTHGGLDVSEYQKLDEVPYDFIRKRLSILVAHKGKHCIVTKGALRNVLAACSFAETATGTGVALDTVVSQIQQRFGELSGRGFRVLGVAYRDIGAASRLTKEDEVEMTFLGFLAFVDPPKPGMGDVIALLHHLGVSLKIITGDNHLVAVNVSQQVGLANARILTGPELRQMSDEALYRRVNAVDVFAEVEPNQKERIILALKKAGHVVGYLGDGINDASALHAADVGISVEGAVDVAKEAADIVLLEHDLRVLVQGVREGRTTFANTLKYVFMATSANFGNMFSMAGASLFLPFLPLLPKQILLTNLLTDVPEMTIASDRVDSELVERPRRWDIQFIRRFMLTFGSVSSVFDYLTFAALVFILHATPEQFRTGWLLESVISAALIVLVVRSRKPVFQSMPGKYLSITTLLTVAVTLLLPYTPLARPLELSPLPPSFLLVMGMIVILYVIAAELAKRVFYARATF